MRFDNLLPAWPLLLPILLLAACAAPEKNAMLEEARSAYASVSSDPQVIRNAPAELNKAAVLLQQAETLKEQDREEAAVSHQAYLARQQALITRQAAELNLAQESIGNFETERQKVLLSARTREAEQSRQLAEQRQKQLEEAQLSAQQRAEQMRQQQADEMARQRQQAQQLAEQRGKELEELQRNIAELKAEQTSRGMVLTLSDIVFEVDQATLNPGSERTIAKISEFLRQHPERTVAIEGFTDATGPEEYNRKLSEARAQSVRDALVRQGIESERIITRGYGEEYPVASNATPTGRQLNRRVEIVISNPDEQVSMR